ncbi:hypothetical protein G9464_17195 [Halostella sp. JP-L12]|uniref:HalOD1 output domain-containing protein n=1 Tax=Halostella TaxID=1843185 RepID=UPI0013CF2693|nr:MULTISPECIES: HalOD1 output domain-containing protein [Halostella]NHN49311.1 hypothetical protein [Halostella sp. JP-L12]
MAVKEMTVTCDCSPVHKRKFDPKRDDPVVEIVDALAKVEGTDPLDLPPLYDSVDIEAVEDLFGKKGGRREGRQIVSFSISKWNVFIRGDGSCLICDANESNTAMPPFEKEISD